VRPRTGPLPDTSAGRPCGTIATHPRAIRTAHGRERPREPLFLAWMAAIANRGAAPAGIPLRARLRCVICWYNRPLGAEPRGLARTARGLVARLGIDYFIHVHGQAGTTRGEE